MPLKHLKLGTRGSRLAMCQSEQVARLLREHNPGLQVELVIIQSTGDQILTSPLWQIGGKGLFTREIEVALLEERIDVAVHSLKDLPTTNTPGLTIAAVPPRESPWDLLLSATPLELADLSENEVIGTSSLRRQALLSSIYPKLKIKDLRGNVPTRLAKMLEGQYRAIVLAEAGINRLQLTAPFTRRLTENELLPAPGQGALGIQSRANDEETISLLGPLNDYATVACTSAERALLHHLGGGCQAPLGAYTKIQDGELVLTGRVVSKDCTQSLQATLSGSIDAPEQLGKSVAAELLEQGASRWMSDWRVNPTEGETNQIVLQFETEMKQKPLYNVPVIVTREEDADGPVSRALRSAGASPICLPLVVSTLLGLTKPMREAVQQIATFDWIILTSKRSFEALLQTGLSESEIKNPAIRWACVGEGTSSRLRAFGVEPSLQASVQTADSLAAELLATLGTAASKTRVLFPRSSIASQAIHEQFKLSGVQLHEVVAYDTTFSRIHDQALLKLLTSKQARCILFCSPSAVDSFQVAWEQLSERSRNEIQQHLIVGSIGPSTSAALRKIPLHVTVETTDRTFDGLVQELSTAYSKT